MPVLLGPVGGLRYGHRDGEVGVARAAGRARTIQIVSTASGTQIEEVTAAATGPVFYQLYFLGSRANVATMIRRAEHAGCMALVLTIDAQAPAHRERPYQQRAYVPRSGSAPNLLHALPQVLTRPAWLADFAFDRARLRAPMGRHEDSRPMSAFDLHEQLWQRTIAWDDIAWIRDVWHGPMMIKGVITVADARRAVDVGADAIVVSNHGGFCIDGTPASLRVLPRVVAAVGDRAEVLMDSGIRRGSDVVKALALGARAVLLGRAYAYALMADGQAGVERILDIFARDIDAALAHLGCASVSSVDASLVHPTWESCG